MRRTLIRAVRGGVSAAAGGVPGVAVGVAAGLVRGGRRKVVVFALCALIAMAFMSVAAVAQFPITVADTAVAWIFGGRGGQAGTAAVPDICAAPAHVHQAPVTERPDPSRAAAPEPAVLAAALGGDGRPTEQAQAALAAIPAGTDVSVAQGWILYDLSHPRDGGADFFAKFSAAFEATAGRLTSQATALDVVSTMDPRADYSPYLLFAQAGGYQMMRQGAITATDSQRDKLVEELAATCEGATAR
jgi:hypothetical protein